MLRSVFLYESAFGREICLEKFNRNSIIAVLAICGLGVAQVLVGQEKADGDMTDGILGEFRALEKSGAASGENWFELAGKARAAGDLSIANMALERAAKEEFSPIRIGVERTRIKVADNDADAAVGEIRKILDAGFTAVAVLTGDPLINSLAGNAGYDAVIAEMSTQAYPCEHLPEFRAFDFWIGEWDVTVGNGVYAGSNSIYGGRAWLRDP